MKIVISPAKSLDYDTPLPTGKYSDPLFLKQAERLHKVLKKKSPKKLSELMGISDNLAELNWKRNQEWSLPFTPDNARPAIYAFNGDVYEGLDGYTIPEEKLDRLQEILRILSGLYGVLRPLDLMQPYRLEMGTSLKVGTKENLYEFWRSTITKTLNKELEKDELFINLASNEYFKAVDARGLKVPVVTPQFKDWKNDQLKVISFYAKKARGLMVRYILDTGAKTVDDLKGFDYEGYSYSEEHSAKKNELVFIR
ncbi:peroxide stress protein YaaA [Sinomicrobium soli]|uniref:peroxide stress protein YaaA n=1 Tax=Sinomicrobium sp. N-1-3-6 TaxID=2219864 RepID=UPI000DCC6C68|nr:peroxide stress protein YaaA [Sinomicrobium sp. N-1-3-6]RAV29904.1 peroxide stress protein YaaA [Sinomicrobium sp. N-1-3-6]